MVIVTTTVRIARTDALVSHICRDAVGAGTVGVTWDDRAAVSGMCCLDDGVESEIIGTTLAAIEKSFE